MNRQVVAVTKKQQIGTLLLNAPETRNALDLQMCEELLHALKDLSADPSIRTIELRGSGRAFSAGGDIKAMRDRSGMFAGSPRELATSYRQTIQQLPIAITGCPKPVIAVIQGAAVGAGFDLACACDFRVATEGAFFAESFASLGLISGFGGAWLLNRLVGRGTASDLALTGRRVQAEEALQMGLVSRFCSHAQLAETLQSLHHSLHAQSAAALAETKFLINQAWLQNLQSHLDAAADAQALLQHEQEHLERVERLLSSLSRHPRSEEEET